MCAKSGSEFQLASMKYCLGAGCARPSPLPLQLASMKYTHYIRGVGNGCGAEISKPAREFRTKCNANSTPSAPKTCQKRADSAILRNQLNASPTRLPPFSLANGIHLGFRVGLCVDGERWRPHTSGKIHLDCPRTPLFSLSPSTSPFALVKCTLAQVRWQAVGTRRYADDRRRRRVTSGVRVRHFLVPSGVVLGLPRGVCADEATRDSQT
ncbi:hypothetical protein C8R46DRAFT_1070047 [Mycena filopes]|nr:hypothetical protein C8R46DRAFT_1070047 [Mycena filopes]